MKCISIFRWWFEALRHNCGFACQQGVLKTFPGLGYLHSEDIFTGKFVCVYIYIYIYIYDYLHKISININVVTDECMQLLK